MAEYPEERRPEHPLPAPERTGRWPRRPDDAGATCWSGPDATASFRAGRRWGNAVRPRPRPAPSAEGSSPTPGHRHHPVAAVAAAAAAAAVAAVSKSDRERERISNIGKQTKYIKGSSNGTCCGLGGGGCGCCGCCGTALGPGPPGVYPAHCGGACGGGYIPVPGTPAGPAALGYPPTCTGFHPSTNFFTLAIGRFRSGRTQKDSRVVAAAAWGRRRRRRRRAGRASAACRRPWRRVWWRRAATGPTRAAPRPF